MKNHTIPLSIILLGILLCTVLGGSFQTTGVSIGVGLGILYLLLFAKQLTVRKKDTTSMSIPIEPKQPLVEQAGKKIEEGLGAVDFSVIGTDYRLQQLKDFEKTIDEVLDVCIKLVHAHINSYSVAIFFPGAKGGFEIRRYFSPDDHIDKAAVITPGVGVVGSFLKGGLAPVKLDDIVSDSTTLYYYQQDAGVRSLIASPIIIEEMEKGLIIVDSKEKQHFTHEDQAFLSAMADFCGRSVYNAYLYNQHRLDHERLVAMSSTEKYFFKEHKIDAVLDKLVEIIPFAFHCERLTIGFLDREYENINIKRAWGHHTEGLSGLTCSIQSKSISNLIFTKNMALCRNFSRDHYEIRFCTEEPQVEEFRSFLAFPIGVENCKGVILLESLRNNAFSETSKELLARLVSSAGIAIEKIDLLEQTENLAIRDGLTGLYNHRQFQHMLKEAITRSLRYKTDLSLVLCDIDHFKKLNDTYGHRFGDAVLKAISGALQSSIREGIDNAARYGGEEFTLILGETGAVSVKETVDRIRQHIADMVFQTPTGKDIHCTLSFGIAIYGVHAKNQELLIKRADKALYKAKENGRNRVEMYLETKKET